MPNWCEGVLKIRGKKEDVLNFLNNGTCYYKTVNGSNIDREYEEYHAKFSINDDFELNVETTDKDVEELRFKTARRNFISLRGNYEVVFYADDNDNETIIVCFDYMAAWSIDVGELKELSKEFNVDFKIYAMERGYQFIQDIEIDKGIIIKDEEGEYDDYCWECIDPRKGG